LTSGELSQADKIKFMKSGIGTTAYYANVVLLFFLNMSYLRRAWNVFFAIILFLGIIFSSYSLAILLLILSILLKLYFLNKINLKTIIITILVIVGIYYAFSIFNNSLLLEPIQRKYNLLSSGNIDADGREKLISNSWNTFTKFPFFGVGLVGFTAYKIVGNHSSWVDYLAFYGLIGVLPFYTFFIVYFKKIVKNEPYVFFAFMLFVLMCFIDPFIPELGIVFTIMLLSSFIQNENNTIYIRR